MIGLVKNIKRKYDKSTIRKILWRASFAGLNSGDFEKRAIRNPARIPPQTPPAGGKSAEAGRIHTPSQLFRPAESALVLFEKGSRKVYNYSTNRELIGFLEAV